MLVSVPIPSISHCTVSPGCKNCGVGYIVMGDVAPINSFSPTPKLFDDSQIPAFKALADSVHAYGTKLGVQLFHPEYDVDAINSLFMQKKFDEMRQRLHHDMMFFTEVIIN